MLDVVDGVLALGAGWLVTYLVHSTVLIGTAWLAVRSGWVSEPESQDLLWKVAALGGLVTATAAMSPTVRMGPQEFIADVEVTGVRGAGIENTMQWQMRQLDAPAELSISSLRAEVVSPSPECRELLRGGALGAPGAAARIRSTCAASAEVEWYHVMVLLWLGGSGVAAVASTARRRALRDLKATLSDARPAVQTEVQALARSAGVQPRVMVSSALDAPCVIDARTIGLPERCENELERDELRAVLAHEVAHVSRRDVTWLGLFRLVGGVLWVQPLNRVALAGQMAAAELVCDDWALARTKRPLGLARLISRVTEWATSARFQLEAPVVAMVGANGRSLADRVRRILSARGEARRALRWKRGLAATALLLPVLFLPPVPRPSTLHAMVFIQEGGDLTGDFMAAGPGEIREGVQRVVVRRFTGG
jgi:hypothetical protein